MMSRKRDGEGLERPGARWAGALSSLGLLLLACSAGDPIPSEAGPAAESAATPRPIVIAEATVEPSARAPRRNAPTEHLEAEMREQLFAATNRFGFRLLARLVPAEQPANAFISPASIALALTMTANGAGSATQHAITDSMGYAELSLEQINDGMRDLMARLEGSDDVELQVANSLWGDQRVQFAEAFLTRMRELYRARIETLIFGRPEAAARINAWVNEQTKGKIPTITDQTSPDDLLYLINAIYFKGMWREPFQESDTETKTFAAPGGPVDVPMMHLAGELEYYTDQRVQVAELTYGEGDIGMVLLLPAEGADLHEVIRRLPGQWAAWTRAMRDRPGRLGLPRFTLEFGTELKAVLADMGMGPAFSSEADFGPMFAEPTPAQISQVIHKTFVEVNEEGTEAAAVTAVTVARSSISTPAQPFEMILDRPFVCVIRDRRSNAILFLGAIVNPAE